MEKKAVSLLEIVVAMFILSATMLGLSSIFIAGKRNIQHTRFKVAASEAAKQFLDQRHMDVRQDTWATNCLGSNGLGCPTTNATMDGFSFAPNFEVSDIPAGLAKKVKLTISWDEYY